MNVNPSRMKNLHGPLQSGESCNHKQKSAYTDTSTKRYTREENGRRSVMRMCELRQKEVINICTGKRLGCIVDVEIDIRCGEVEAVIIPGPGKICGFFGADCEFVIPFSCIRRIGPDIILVEIQEEKFLQKL